MELTKAYIKAMNSGSLPNIDNAWQYLVKNESKKAMLSNELIFHRHLCFYIAILFLFFHVLVKIRNI